MVFSSLFPSLGTEAEAEEAEAEEEEEAPSLSRPDHAGPKEEERVSYDLLIGQVDRFT